MSQSASALVGALDLRSLQGGYQQGQFSPVEVAHAALQRIAAHTGNAEWAYRVPDAQVLQQAQALTNESPALPYYGLPFSVKDNIDVAGLPTTAGCAAYSYIAERTAPVVQQLLDGGALLMGKNTMDEFATGVVGVRSNPHPSNPFNSDYIPGGSSSGSGVVVSKGCVSFALGSDTGGSGRVPAALCNIVGFKASPYQLSNLGMVYANESIDCIPIFCRYVYDADYIYRQLRQETMPPQPRSLSNAKIAIPDKSGLQFFGDGRSEQCFNSVLQRFIALGCTIEAIDFTPFSEAGKLLFDGALVSERYHSVGDFIDDHSDAVHPTVKAVISNGKTVTTQALWQDLHKLRRIKDQVYNLLGGYDFLLTPTAASHYTIAQVNADPINLNRNMAYYTNFSNLLDLAVIAVPGDFRADGLPFGISFTTTKNQELALLNFARMWEETRGIAPGCALYD